MKYYSERTKLEHTRTHTRTHSHAHVYLWFSLKASFPFLHEMMPRGDILGLHSIRTSPPCRARVWAFNRFWEKSGAMADGKSDMESKKKRNLE